MFYYIEGVVAHTAPALVVIDCGGVGYALTVSSAALSRARAGEKLRLYTYLYVREDAVELFGFYDTKEKDCFLMLLDITGVGPKAALAILSVASPDALALGIVRGDEKLLTRAAGVGKKLAARIILELKDKLAKALGSEPASFEEAAESGVSLMSKSAASATEALIVLGYSRAEAQKAVLACGDISALTTEEIIRAALKNS